MVKEIVRIGVSNNFNCTENEYRQLSGFKMIYPDKAFFVNSNINTKNLESITKTDTKIVITANPMLTYNSIGSVCKKLEKVKNNIAFLRIKYLPDNQDILQLIKSVNAMNIPIVITIQRFNTTKMLQQYTQKKYYEFKNSRFKLIDHELIKLYNIVDSLENVYICDKKGIGCKGCNLCSLLTIGQKLPISSLNLSASGICPFNCPDCYAKTMQRFCISMGNNPITYDKIQKNIKQTGKTAHIKDKLKIS